MRSGCTLPTMGMMPAGFVALLSGWFVTEINRDYLSGPQGVAMQREVPVGRFGAEGDLDGALLLLASDAGAYIAGATIVVDGGQMVALRG